MLLIIDQIITALMLGTIYALIASGYSLYSGILKVINISHADVCFLGAFISMAVVTYFPKIGFLPVWLLLLFAMLITGLFGIVFEKIFIKPFRKSTNLIMLLSTFAAGIIIREGIKIFFPSGASPKLFPLSFPDWQFMIGNVTIRFGNIMIIIIAGIIYLLLSIFINYTKIGLQMRATSQNMDAALRIGIDLDKIFMITFFLGSIIGMVAGVLNGMYYSIIKYNMGQTVGIIGFSAAIMGGLGNIYAAIFGGMVLGLVESLTAAFIPGGSPYKEIFAFLVVIFFLLFKPSGLFGKKTIEKV